MSKFTLYAIFLSFLVASCGITKRHYRPGFYFRHHLSFETKEKENQFESKQQDEEFFAVEEQQESRIEDLKNDEINENAVEALQPKIGKTIPAISGIRKKLLEKSIIHAEVEAGGEPLVDNNTELARWYADRAMRYAIISICFIWTGWALFIFGPLALNRAKRAIFLNEEQDADIKSKAERAAKIVSFGFSLASLALLIGILILILSI